MAKHRAAEKGASSFVSFKSVYEVMKERNESAAVDMYGRAFIGALGLLIAISVIIFAESAEKWLSAIFFIFPVSLVMYGLIEDYLIAKHVLLNRRAF